MQKWQYGSVYQTRRYVKTPFGTQPESWVITQISPILVPYHRHKEDTALDIANTAGLDGWELFSILTQSGADAGDPTGYTNERHWIFKRPIPDQ